MDNVKRKSTRMRKFEMYCFKNLFLRFSIFFVLFTGLRLNAVETCATTDGLELGINSSGTVSSIKINSGTQSLLSVSSGFSFQEICPNLINNPNFDYVTGSVPNNWTFVSGAGTVTYDDTIGYFDDGCVKIYVPGTTDAISGYPRSDFIDAEPGVEYTVSARGKASGVYGTGEPCVRVVELDENNSFIIQYNIIFSRNSDWETKSRSFTTNANTRKIYVYANIWNSYGTFWVDNIRVKTYAKWVKSYDNNNIVSNANFDYVTSGVPDNWTLVPGTGSVTYDATEGYGANGSVKVYVPGTTDANSGYPRSDFMNAKPNTVYSISAWGKASNVNGTGEPCVRVAELDANNSYIKQHFIIFNRNSDWHKRNVVFTTTTETKKLYVYANIWNSYGTFWVDDIVLGEYLTDRTALGGSVVKNVDNSITQTVVKDGIEFVFNYVPKDKYIEVSGSMQDLTGDNRVINLRYDLPLNAASWYWHDDITSKRQIQSGTLYEHTYKVGDVRKQNTYPFSCVTNGSQGLALATLMDAPRMYRIGYDTNNGYSIDFDFGLANGTNKIGAGYADFKFIIYKIDEPLWGFRSLAKKYYDLFPQFFKKRNDKEGIWFVGSAYTSIDDVDDFGFAFHVSHFLYPADRIYDKQHGVYSMQYTEPWGWWRDFPGISTEPTYSEKIAALMDDYENGTGMWADVVTVSYAAEAVLNTAPYDKNGEMYLYDPFYWSNWGSWSQNFPENPDPDIPSPNRCDVSYARYNWSNNPSDYPCNGFHLDSLFGNLHWPAIENYRLSHWQYADFPLVFSYETNQPILLNAFSQYECIKYLHDNMNNIGKRVDANIFTYSFSLYGNVVDVFGSEYGAVKMNYADASLHRTMAYHKTNRNLLQWQEDTDQVTHEEMEEYINDQMFYGMFPGICIAGPESSYGNNRYWHQPLLYNRDRILFKKYIPIIKEISAAGWEPVTYASCSNSDIKIERFGQLYFTVGSKTSTTESGTVTIYLDDLGFNPSNFSSTFVMEMCSGTKTNLSVSNNQVSFSVQVDPDKTLVYKLGLENSGCWKFSETSGTSTADDSDLGNDGILTNMSTPSCWTGGGLQFDGSDDYVDCGNDSNLSMTDAITVEAWVKFNSLSSTEAHCIVSKGFSTATNYWMDVRDAGNTIWFGGYTSSGTGCYIYAFNCGLTIGKWYHLVGTYDRKWMKLYINGEEKLSVEKTAALGATANPLRIGARGNGHLLNGIVSEVRLYHRALLGNRIYERYWQGLDLVGCWNLNEGKDSTAYDSAGNRLDGTLTNIDISSCWVDGRIKGGLEFGGNGSGDYVDCGNDSSLDISDNLTVEAWVKFNPTSNIICIISKGAGTATNYWMDIRDSGNTIWFGGYNSSGMGCYVYAVGCGLTAGKWYHLVGTYDRTNMKIYINGTLKASAAQTDALGTNTSPLRIGARGTGYSFDGVIDEVKIYNTTLDSDKVSEHYQAGIVKGKWSMDEDSGDTAYDSSCNRNTSYLVNMNTANCHVNGKIGKALEFDGSDDYVDCGYDSSLDITGNLTIEAWVKFNVLDSRTQCVVAKGFNTVTNYWMDIRDAGNTIYFGGYNSSQVGCYIIASNCGLTTNQWYHLVGTYDGADMKLYINGVQKVSQAKTDTLGAFTVPLQIGKRGSGYPFDGIIDELRIYDTALSATEVAQHYADEN